MHKEQTDRQTNILLNILDTKMSCIQWQKAQVFVYFRPWILEETITHTDSLKKALTIAKNGRGQTPPTPPPPQVKILGWKLPYDLPLVERIFPGKFRCICSYRVEMHNGQTNKQTNKQTNFLLYIYRLMVQFLLLRNSWIPSQVNNGKMVIKMHFYLY